MKSKESEETQRSEIRVARKAPYTHADPRPGPTTRAGGWPNRYWVPQWTAHADPCISTPPTGMLMSKRKESEATELDGGSVFRCDRGSLS